MAACIRDPPQRERYLTVFRNQIDCGAPTKKYGKDAWEKFNSIQIDGKTTDLTNMHVDRDVVVSSLKKGIHFKIDGDVAVCILPWSGMKQRFIKPSMANRTSTTAEAKQEVGHSIMDR